MPDSSNDRPEERTGRRRIWRVGAVEFDEGRRELRVDGERRGLEGKPAALLHALLVRAGEVTTKDELMTAAWGNADNIGESSLTTAMSKLRVALGPSGRDVVEVIHGVGYRIAKTAEVQVVYQKPAFAFAFKAGEAVPGRPQWRLVQALGAALANDVWLARHDKTREQRVFKFADTAGRLDSLKREATLSRVLLATLGERNDFARVAEWNFEERPYFIESVYGGPDLARWIEARGPLATLPLAARIDLVAQAARSVAAAHGAGVLHSDLKPSNILVSDTDEGLRVRLVDFGAGGLTEAARTEMLTVSLAGLSDPGLSGRTGTLRYLAPEVLTGAAPTTGADLYALGILLYQIAVADLDRPLAAGWEADIDDPLLRADIAEAAAGNTGRRLQSAAELANRLERLDERRAELAQTNRAAAEREHLMRSVEARRQEAVVATGRAAHASALARRTRTAAAALLAMLAAAVALGFYARTQERAAVAQSERALRVTEAAQDGVSQLVDNLASSLRDRAGMPRPVLRRLLDGAGGIAAAMARAAPEEERFRRLQGRALAQFAEVYLNEGDLDRASDAAARAVELQTSLLKTHPNDRNLKIDLATSHRWEGEVRSKEHRFSEAETSYEAGRDIMLQLDATDPADTASATTLLALEVDIGDVSVARGDLAVSLAAFKHALGHLAPAVSAHPDDRELQNALGLPEQRIADVLEDQGNLPGALAMQEAGLGLGSWLVARDPTNKRYLRNLAVGFMDLCRVQAELNRPEAVLASQQARVTLQIAADQDPSDVLLQHDIAGADDCLGVAQAAAGMYNLAGLTFQRVIGTLTALISRSPDDVEMRAELADVETDAARAGAAAGDRSAALAHAEAAGALLEPLCLGRPDDQVLAEALNAAHEIASQARAPNEPAR